VGREGRSVKEHTHGTAQRQSRGGTAAPHTTRRTHTHLHTRRHVVHCVSPPVCAVCAAASASPSASLSSRPSVRPIKIPTDTHWQRTERHFCHSDSTTNGHERHRRTAHPVRLYRLLWNAAVCVSVARLVTERQRFFRTRGAASSSRINDVHAIKMPLLSTVYAFQCCLMMSRMYLFWFLLATRSRFRGGWLASHVFPPSASKCIKHPDTV
jgi:hypothetical protein